MKKLLLLLFIPFVCFGQSYNDIISIDSKEQFIRVGIENDYEIIKNQNDYVQIALNPTYEDNGDIKAKAFAEFSANNKVIEFSLFQFLKDDIWEKKKYNDIFSFVKEKCKFKEVDKTGFSYYTVNENLQIGFQIEKDWCYVKLTKNLKQGLIITYYNSGEILYKAFYVDGIKQGKATSYFKNGEIFEKSNYKDGIQQGWHIYYDGSGKIGGEGNYVDGRRQGEHISYYNNGQVHFKINFVDGIRQGKSIFYDLNGEISSIQNYKDGVFLEE
jgi:antitoxin component YwqK of YwqJK toxin-antitoxin module